MSALRVHRVPNVRRRGRGRCGWTGTPMLGCYPVSVSGARGLGASFLGCFEGFSSPSPGSPFSRDLYPALIKRSAVCAVLSGVSASYVGAARARPGLGKRGAGRDRRERPRSAPGTGLSRLLPAPTPPHQRLRRRQAGGGAAWCAEAPRGPGAEPPLPMGSGSRSPARGGRSERERDRDREKERDRDRERERDRGRSRSGSRGRRHRSKSRSRSRGRRRELSSGSDSGDERQKWKKKKRSSSRDRHRKDRRKQRSRSRGRSSGSSPECGRDRAARSRERRRRRDGSKSSVSSVSSPSPPRPRGREEPGQQLSLQERLRLREEKKKQAALLKALETPEEKRARRLAKKEAKERKKREKMGWGEEYMGYTNTDNPFGDNNLLGTFIWSKALEKKGISHLDEKDLKERNKRIQEDNRLELQKVKQLRLEREREKAMREQELEMLQREKEAEHFKTWEEQEDNFHLQQAKLRSKIRIRDGRAKPIDLLAKYISAEDDDLAVEMHEPYTFLNGLTVSDMEDLVEDIQVYMELEQGKNVDFWRDMTIITEDEIAKLRKLEASGKGGPGERRDGVNASVSSDVQSVFKGKTYNQLQALYQGIESKIRAGGPNLDIGYWESLLQQLKAYMARARLRERHQDVLRQKLYKLKQEQGVESEPLFPIIKREPASPSDRLDPEDNLEAQPGPSSEPEAEQDTETKGEAEGEAVLMEEDLIQQSLDDYDAGKYSPRLLGPNELPFDAHVLEAEEDMHRLLLLRQQLQVTGDASESTDDIFFRKAKEGMGADEAQFSVEMPLTGKAYLWADKYRPRKPRFFNRVHTGFEWNKYNQTHYDFDNPPPKIVQGYKFNIFYPDLIDKRSTPEYFLEACQDNKDFAILRFHAGPPYEDIAFKIVNREWEYSHRHGFRCQFANGIFQLWFHFKRYRYRR
ncbi:PREDICTED: cactin [Sturnus vulgaris]|uniref:cactin n=1 Tax=Sturnus vulgaris TaxID=9172 RepID=UPI00071A4AF4|nr:PREDICTED: cactin [Sturnus vulgaris]